ncbi:MAG: glucose-1-phosphate adenylyltransferase subunit GlgD [Clostridia bacterium]
MNNIMSIIFASDNESKLNELTLHRTTASLPFCGRYRFIDFTLSNLVNSQITTIGIVTRSNYSSLMDHIRMGRDWDLNRKNSGIAVFPPYSSNTARSVFKGKVEAIYGILDYVEKANEDYIILTNSNIAANLDFDAVYDYHIQKGADLTVLTYKSQPTTSRRMLVETDEDNRIVGTRITQSAAEESYDIGLNIYLLKKSLLIDLVVDCYERGGTDFEKNIIQQKLDELKIYSYPVTGHTAIIDDVKSYYTESMKILDSNVRNDLFYSCGKIFTKVKDSVPTKYGDKAVVKNSLIADGCEINGTVENSILFRGVVVEEGSEISNSIVMENGVIMKDAKLGYTITDKDVTITNGKIISGYETYPLVIVKNKTI